MNRSALVRRGKRLEYFTIVWNSTEGLVAVVAGVMAGSISLMAFGIDSFIEVVSGSVLLWRIAADSDKRGRELREKLSLRVVGLCFIALGLYVAVDAVLALARREAPRHSIPGIVLAVVSLIVMPVLARAKRKVGVRLDSAALVADSAQTQFCVYLSAIMLAGLILNATVGLWWADPAAALSMVPLIAKEGIESLRGKRC
ncbi:MAG: cation diffusion facilitator family transporter [Terriglobia bacterium]